MVKVQVSHHIGSKRASTQRKLALQKQELAREEEKLRLQIKQQLPAYDPDGEGRFGGYDPIFRHEGDNYEGLHRVLKKIMRPAHYRTWAAAHTDKGNGPPPCLSAREIAELVGRHRRTIEVDLQEMRKKEFLYIHPVQRDGRWIMEMHYGALYQLAYEYILWERSADYIPPERTYFEYITLSPDRRNQLLQFEDYRKVLARKKPGPKPQKKSDCHEGAICSQRGVSDGSQHIHSASPIQPAAFQGAMERGTYSEPSTSPALPQVGRSGSAHPNIPIHAAVLEGRPSSAINQQPVLQRHPGSAINEQQHPASAMNQRQPFSEERPSSAINQQSVSQERPPKVIEQQVSQERPGGSVFQEVPMSSFPVTKFKRWDCVGNFCIYPTSSLPLFFADLPPELDEPNELGIAPGLPVHVDKDEILHISGKYVPFLRDLLKCTRASYDTSRFHHRTAFEPEILRHFDSRAVGAWAAYDYDADEVLLMQELDAQWGDLDEYIKFFAKDLENVLCYQDESLKSHMITVDGQEVSLFDVQNKAVQEYVPLEVPYDLTIESIWTDQFRLYIEHGHPTLRYFIPYKDFPPDVQDWFLPHQVGVWVTRRPGEEDAYIQPCFEVFMEHMSAQPAHHAIILARVTYVMNLYSTYTASTMEYVPSTPLTEKSTDELPACSANTFDSQETSYDYGHEDQVPTNNFPAEIPESIDNYTSETPEDAGNYEINAQPMNHDYSTEQAGITVRQTAGEETFQETFLAETQNFPETTMSANKMEGPEPYSDKPINENGPCAPAGSPGYEQMSASVPHGSLNNMNTAHRTLSRRIVGNRHNRRDQESRKRPAFVQVEEIIHYDGVERAYPRIVPLLPDFMCTKLLGNDTVRRYYIPFTSLKSDVKSAYPPGADGVWLWKQPDSTIVHVKPTTFALDPYLKNRIPTSIAVGKVVDDDGYLYLDEIEENPTAEMQQPEEHYEEPYSEQITQQVPHLEQPEVRRTPAPRTHQPHVDDYERVVPQVPPLEPSASRSPSNPRSQQPGFDDHGRVVPQASSFEPSTSTEQQSYTNDAASQQFGVDDYSKVASNVSPSGPESPSTPRDQPLEAGSDSQEMFNSPPLGRSQAERKSTSRTTQGANVDRYGNVISGAPPSEQQRTSGLSTSGTERADKGGNAPSKAPPLHAHGKENMSPPRTQQPRVDKDGNRVLEQPSSQPPGRASTAAPKFQQLGVDRYGNAPLEAPPLQPPGSGNMPIPRAQQLETDKHKKVVPPFEQQRAKLSPTSGWQEPKMDKSGNTFSGAPPVGPQEHMGHTFSGAPPVGWQDPKMGKPGNTFSGAPPIGWQSSKMDKSGHTFSGAPPMMGWQDPKMGKPESTFSGAPPVGKQRPKRDISGNQQAAGATSFGEHHFAVNGHEMPSSASPPRSVEQKRQQLEAVLKRARDGHGKGPQRLF